MQVDPNAPSSSTASSSSSSQYGGWAAFPSAHATTPAFNSFGQPQPHSQQQLEQQQQLQHLANMQQNQSHYPMNGYGASLKRTRSNDGQAPEPSAKRPQFTHHAASAPFMTPAMAFDPQAQLLAHAEHLRLNSPLNTPPLAAGSPAQSSYMQPQHEQQQPSLFGQEQQQQQQPVQAPVQPALARMEDLGAGVSFMGYAAHELQGSGLEDDMEMDDDCTNPVPWGSSRSTHFPENAEDQLGEGQLGQRPRRGRRQHQSHQAFPTAQKHQLPFGYPSQTPASTPHHSPHQQTVALPPVSPLSHASPAASYHYGSPRPLQPPPSASKTGSGYTMGPRADCEKCRLGVKGHYGHIGSGGR